jgi:hypothetical protein
MAEVCVAGSGSVGNNVEIGLREIEPFQFVTLGRRMHPSASLTCCGSLCIAAWQHVKMRGPSIYPTTKLSG